MALILGINRSARTRGCRRRLLWLLIWSTAGIVGHARSGQSAKHDSGWYYFHEEAPEVPWSIHFLKIERAHRDLQFCTALGNGGTLGMNTVSEQVKRLPMELGQPVAAVNGDFYNKHENYPGDPRDLQIQQGELVSSPK